jgi:hypothetical protein
MSDGGLWMADVKGSAVCNRRPPICKKDLHQQESIIDIDSSKINFRGCKDLH